MAIRSSPFHNRTAEHNRGNDWRARNGLTVPSVYEDVQAESLAARTGLVIADISWWSRVLISGEEARLLADHLFTNEASSLWPQHGVHTLWLSDNGGVRGVGSIARYSADAFLLTSQVEDFGWFMAAAMHFDVQLRDYAQGMGGLALIGPYAITVLKEIGFPTEIARGAFHRFDWRGVQVALSHHGAGFEIWVRSDDALIVWDRVMAAGQTYGIRPAGLDALDLLSLELGDPLSVAFAREPFSAGPSVSLLGLSHLVDAEHASFNGRNAYRAQKDDTKRLVGLLLDSDRPMADTILRKDGHVTGNTLASLYSPALRRAIALGIVERAAALPRTKLDAGGVNAIVTPLPFLPLS